MNELPERILDVAWRTFSESQRQHNCDSTALADALTAVAPMIRAEELRRVAYCCAAPSLDAYLTPMLHARADELDPDGAS